jgi:hypothetical protein
MFYAFLLDFGKSAQNPPQKSLKNSYFLQISLFLPPFGEVFTGTFG